MKIANLITLSRLVFVAAAFALVAAHPETARGAWWGDPAVLGFLFVAAVTDMVDGWVARRFRQTSLLGRVLDPFADKVLVCGTLVMFLELPDLAPLLPAWAVVVTLSREFLVQSLRGVAEARGHSFAADWFGKWKMFFQCVWVMALAAYQSGWDWTYDVACWSLWVALAFTLVSGVNYVRKAWDVLEF